MLQLWMHNCCVAERPGLSQHPGATQQCPFGSELAALPYCLWRPSEIPRTQPSLSSLLAWHEVSLPVRLCSFGESCKRNLRPKQLSIGPSRCRGLIQGVPDSLMPLSAHHSPFEDGMFLVGSHLLQRLDRGTLLAYTRARPNFHPTGLVSRHYQITTTWIYPANPKS